MKNFSEREKERNEYQISIYKNTINNKIKRKKNKHK